MASENGVGEVKPNKKVILKSYVSGFPKESDMEVVTTETVRLNVPEGSSAVLLKTLYLSCDPYMRSRMARHDRASYVPDFVLGSVNLLKIKFGFSEAFNCEEQQDLNAALKRYFPEGIYICFENVGGTMLDAVLLNMQVYGQIAVCGMISQLNLEKPNGIHNLTTLIAKRVRMQGFTTFDYYYLYPQFVEKTVQYIEERLHTCCFSQAAMLESRWWLLLASSFGYKPWMMQNQINGRH